MKVTKKTRLLGWPKVKIGELRAVADDVGATFHMSGIEHLEAVEAYDAEGGRFNGEIIVNGVSRGKDEFLIVGEGRAFQCFGDMKSGDEVKVALYVDPAKTRYDPTPAEATAVVS